jgi:hypothetical protein
MMFRCTIVLVLALAGSAAAAPPMWVMEPRSSVALDALARGRLRLWLGTHVEICRIDTKQRTLTGDLKVHLDVAPRRGTKVTVAATHRMPRAVAACLTRNLRSVRFGELASRLVWDGTLHLDPSGPSIEVAIESLYSKLDEVVVRSAVVAALEQPAACMTRFFTATPVGSAVVIAKLDVDGAHVTESTADPGGAVACVASLLDPLVWPKDQWQGAQLRISLLRPTAEVDGDAVMQLRSEQP